MGRICVHLGVLARDDLIFYSSSRRIFLDIYTVRISVAVAVAYLQILDDDLDYTIMCVSLDLVFFCSST